MKFRKPTLNGDGSSATPLLSLFYSSFSLCRSVQIRNHPRLFPSSYTEYQALNINKIKHHKPSSIQFIREIDIFSNTGPYKVSYVLSGCQYGHQSGTAHIKTIFSFWTGTGKRFIGNALCISDDSIIFCTFHEKTISLTKLQKK